MSYLYVEHDVLVPNRRYVKTRAEGKAARESDLFHLVVVNSYGSQEVQGLKDDDSIPLKLGSEWMCVLREEEGVWREGVWGGGGRLDDWPLYVLFPQIRRTLRVSGRQT